MLSHHEYDRELTSANGIDELALLSKKKLHPFTDRKVRDVQSLKFYLKSLQEKGIYLINRKFDCFTIDHEDFSNFVNDPISKDILDSDQDPRLSPSETYYLP